MTAAAPSPFDVAQELLRCREIVSVLDALASAGLKPILLKGTPLAYSMYDQPAERPRGDTDLLIRRAELDRVRRTLAALEYEPTLYCDGELLFGQLEMARRDAFGLVHALDVHWTISTQTLFASLLTFDELAADAVAVPALGPNARTAGPVHALLLACVHPVMHHRNEQVPEWTRDVHLLASRLSEAELDRFVALALDKRVGAIAARQLAVARQRFGTPIHDRALTRLTRDAGDEPSAAYLRHGRRWHDELASNLSGLPTWSDRLTLVREVLFPSPSYMRRAYRVAAGPLGSALLPSLYVHRGVKGFLKVLAGRK